MMLAYMICHLVGVSSSCSNPILYGFLNDNFIREFSKLHPGLEKVFNPKESTLVKNDSLHLQIAVLGCNIQME